MTLENAQSKAFWAALLANFVWINASEIARYFWVIRPMLQEAYPGQSEIAPMSWSVFAIWSLWDLILIVAATGFYWLWLERFGAAWIQVFWASLAFSITVFGLIWLGIGNMGLAPFSLLFAALPLAWAEQAIACAITAHFVRRVYSPSSIRSI